MHRLPRPWTVDGGGQPDERVAGRRQPDAHLPVLDRSAGSGRATSSPDPPPTLAPGPSGGALLSSPTPRQEPRSIRPLVDRLLVTPASAPGRGLGLGCGWPYTGSDAAWRASAALISPA